MYSSATGRTVGKAITKLHGNLATFLRQLDPRRRAAEGYPDQVRLRVRVRVRMRMLCWLGLPLRVLVVQHGRVEL